MRIAAIVMVLAGLTNTAAAQRTGLFPVEGTNLDQGEAEAIGVMVATAYSAESGSDVVGPDQTGPALSETGSMPAAASRLGLEEYLTVQAVRLDLKLVVTATRHNRHGSKLYRVQTQATSLDDMPVVADRLSASLYRRTELVHTRDLDNVTGTETRVPNRMFSEKIFGPRVALAMPFAKGMDATPGVMVQFDGRMEGEDYFLEFALGFLVRVRDNGEDDEWGGLVGHLGGSYYLTHTNISPYLGLGVSPRLLGGNAYSGEGLTANAHFGLMFMRHSSSRIYVELQVDQNLVPQDYDNEGKVDSVWPTELSLAVGIGW